MPAAAGRIAAGGLPVASAGPERPSDPPLAAELLARGRLTPFQAEQLLAGRWRGFELVSALNTPRLLEVKIETDSGACQMLSFQDALAHGEELCAAAAREAHEEAGLIGAVSSSMAGRYSYVKSDAGDGMRCEVMVYPLEVGAFAGKWKEKGQRRRKWFSSAKAAERVAEAELAELIREFVGTLQTAA